jgi:hypothetical protein
MRYAAMMTVAVAMLLGVAAFSAGESAKPAVATLYYEAPVITVSASASSAAPAEALPATTVEEDAPTFYVEAPVIEITASPSNTARGEDPNS